MSQTTRSPNSFLGVVQDIFRHGKIELFCVNAFSICLYFDVAHDRKFMTFMDLVAISMFTAFYALDRASRLRANRTAELEQKRPYP